MDAEGKRRWFEAAGLTALLGLTALYAGHPLFSVDLHWHLALGAVIADRGAIPSTDLFSAVQPDASYVQFNWLWELVAHWIVSIGSERGLRIAQALAMTACFAGLYAAARNRTSKASFAMLFTALALVMFEDRMRARPDALNIGFLAAMLPLLTGGMDPGRWWTRLGVFVLALLWSNLHGGASLLLLLSLGALSVGASVGGRLAFSPSRRSLDLWVLFALAALGVFCSPTLLPGLMHWFEAVRPQIASGNEEWLPSYTMLRHGISAATLIVGLGPTAIALLYVLEQVGRLRRSTRAAIDLGEVMLCAGYLVLAHHAVRNSFLALLPVLFMLQRAAAAAVPGRTVVVAGAAVLLAAVSFQDVVLDGYGGLERAVDFYAADHAPAVYPKELADFMERAGIEGPVLNDGRWGGYLIWRTWPKCRVFADTRHHFTKEMWTVFDAAHSPLHRLVAMDAAFVRWGVELAVFEAPTFPLIRPPDHWQLLYKAGTQELHQHRDGPHAALNLERARLALADMGFGVPPDAAPAQFARAATLAGAQRWLDNPYTRLRAETAGREVLQGDAAAGHRRLARLYFQAGDYSHALQHAARSIEADPSDPRPYYYRAFSAYLLERVDLARAALAALGGVELERLSADQRGRLALLRGALAARP